MKVELILPVSHTGLCFVQVCLRGVCDCGEYVGRGECS